MRNMPAYPVAARTWIGAVLALIVLVLDIVFIALGQLDLKPGLLIGGLALALLL
jgi:hypothetical protein